MAVSEYWIHRLFMHKPILGRTGFFKWIYLDHSVEHHGRHRNDINIDLPVTNHLIIGLPYIILVYVIGGIIAVVSIIIVFAIHSYVWTKMHRGIHGIETNWLTKTRYYEYCKKHHEQHHTKPNTNFGVVFPITDYIFFTKC